MFSKKRLFVAAFFLLALFTISLFYLSVRKKTTTQPPARVELVPHQNFEATLLSFTPKIKMNKDENTPSNRSDTAALNLLYSNYSQQDYKNIQATLHVEPDLPHQINFDHHDPTTFIPRELISTKDTKFYLGGLKKGELRETGFTFRAKIHSVVTIYATIVVDDNLKIKTNKITLTVTE